MSIRHSGWVDARERLTWLPAGYRQVTELQSGGEEWRPAATYSVRTSSGVSSLPGLRQSEHQIVARR